MERQLSLNFGNFPEEGVALTGSTFARGKIILNDTGFVPQNIGRETTEDFPPGTYYLVHPRSDAPDINRILDFWIDRPMLYAETRAGNEEYALGVGEDDNLPAIVVFKPLKKPESYIPDRGFEENPIPKENVYGLVTFDKEGGDPCDILHQIIDILKLNGLMDSSEPQSPALE